MPTLDFIVLFTCNSRFDNRSELELESLWIFLQQFQTLQFLIARINPQRI